jgi:hypothetical protein
MGIKQIIPTKKFEDIRTSIFAIGQGRYAMLTVPSSLGCLFTICQGVMLRDYIVQRIHVICEKRIFYGL